MKSEKEIIEFLTDKMKQNNYYYDAGLISGFVFELVEKERADSWNEGYTLGYSEGLSAGT